MTKQERIQQAKDADKEKSKKAIEYTDKNVREELKPFLYFLPQNKCYDNQDRGNSDNWQTLINPYAGVDYRVKDFTEDHKSQKKIFHNRIKELNLEKGYIWVTVETELLGSADGLATIERNPQTGKIGPKELENAQTSAIGRALGFLGYGILPGGIATAEEMISYLNTTGATGGKIGGNGSTNKTPGKATDSQIKYLNILFKEFTPEETEKFLKGRKLKDFDVETASSAIEYLKPIVAKRKEGTKEAQKSHDAELAIAQQPMSEADSILLSEPPESFQGELYPENNAPKTPSIRKASTKQKTYIYTLMNNLEMDKKDMLQLFCDTSKREIKSANDLTSQEASKVIEYLKEQQVPEPASLSEEAPF